MTTSTGSEAEGYVSLPAREVRALRALANAIVGDGYHGAPGPSRRCTRAAKGWTCRICDAYTALLEIRRGTL